MTGAGRALACRAMLSLPLLYLAGALAAAWAVLTAIFNVRLNRDREAVADLSAVNRELSALYERSAAAWSAFLERRGLSRVAARTSAARSLTRWTVALAAALWALGY